MGPTLAFFGVAVILLALFLVLQARTTHPMMPLRLLRDRNGARAYVSVAISL